MHMPGFTASCRRISARLLGALLIAASASWPAQAQGTGQGQLKAHFTISMTGISIGHVVWLVDIGEKLYSTSASGKASGVLSMLVNGEGSVATHGSLSDGRLTPNYFTSDITDDDGTIGLRMSYADGNVKELMDQPPPPRADRVPVTDADRRDTVDPLTAVLLPAPPGDALLAPAMCNRMLEIFDGRRRYNLSLSFNRIDKVVLDHGYAGPALVCAVILTPIAGYRADSMLVKYVAGRRDMELWFAPIAGTSIVAPIRVLMPTLIGTLRIQADQFDSVKSPASPPAPAATAPR